MTLTDVDDNDDDDMCTVVVALMQKHRRFMKRHGGANLTIGYEIYQVLGVQSYGPYHIQRRIQGFPHGGARTPKIAIIFQIFAENCMKMKEFGPPGEGRIPGAPWICQ